MTIFKSVENSLAPALLYMFVKTLKIGYLENHLLDNIFDCYNNFVKIQDVTEGVYIMLDYFGVLIPHILGN